MELPTCLQHSKDVEFQDVYYNITERKNYVKVTGTRQILRGVSGCFRNGELSAIMGPSGAGKSSLLNAISGYRTSGITGQMKINRANSCYITQEDHHQTLLTVGELMQLSCDLKLKNFKRKRFQLITEILESLHLNHRRDITAEKLSGGERKRLSVALELVANPKIFFLDEPTSGLDEVTAAQCIRLLRLLAKQGRTIVCTIHQPSATIFNYFDKIFVLARGQCVYQGSPSAVIPFLRHVRMDCPKYYSPSDYIIELCDSEEGKLIPMLSELTENGKLIYIPQDESVELPRNCPINAANVPSKVFYQAITSLFLEEPKSNGLQSFFNVGTPATDGTLIGGATAIFEHMKAFSKLFTTDHMIEREISTFRQFYVLLKMMLVRILRSRIILFIQLIHHVLCGLFFGLIFYRLGNQGERMFDHLKFCIGAVLMIVYTQVMVPILSFPAEVKIVKKHTFNRWYSLTPYYLALTISRIPFQMLFNMFYLSLTYWMTGLPQQLWRFGLFTLVGQLTSLVAEGMGLAIGATFSITNGSAVGPLIIAPFMGLAIYGFDFAKEIPMLMNILMKFSYIRVSVVAFVISLFGFNRPDLDCNEFYCHFADPRVLLRFLDLEKVSMAEQLLLLCSLLVFFRVLLLVSLKIRCGTA